MEFMLRAFVKDVGISNSYVVFLYAPEMCSPYFWSRGFLVRERRLPELAQNVFFGATQFLSRDSGFGFVKVMNMA